MLKNDIDNYLYKQHKNIPNSSTLFSLDFTAYKK